MFYLCIVLIYQMRVYLFLQIYCNGQWLVKLFKMLLFINKIITHINNIFVLVHTFPHRIVNDYHMKQ